MWGISRPSTCCTSPAPLLLKGCEEFCGACKFGNLEKIDLFFLNFQIFKGLGNSKKTVYFFQMGYLKKKGLFFPDFQGIENLEIWKKRVYFLQKNRPVFPNVQVETWKFGKNRTVFPNFQGLGNLEKIDLFFQNFHISKPLNIW